MGFVKNEKNNVIFMTSPNITTAHAFTTRIGGVSSGIYKSLNLSQSGSDDKNNVKENYSLLCKTIGISPDDIVCSNQVHGTNIRVVTKEDCGFLFKPNPNEADGLITQTPGVALMVFTADCVPVLLYDPVKKVAGAIHAGWRSTVANIVGITVRTMICEFGCSPTDIQAAIGPCISKCCFLTDNDVADAISEALPVTSKECISRQDDKFMIDLKEANRILLANTGITDINISDECTSCRSDKYWSHRKTQGNRGSQAAIIMVRD